MENFDVEEINLGTSIYLSHLSVYATEKGVGERISGLVEGG